MKSGDSLSVKTVPTNASATPSVDRETDYTSEAEVVEYTDTYMPELLCVGIEKPAYNVASNFIQDLSFEKYVHPTSNEELNFHFFEHFGEVYAASAETSDLDLEQPIAEAVQQPADSDSTVLATGLTFAERPAIDSLQTVDVQPLDFNGGDVSQPMLGRFGLQEYASRDSYVLLESHPELVFGSRSLVVDKPLAKNVGVPIVRENPDLGFVNFSMLTIGLVMLVVAFKFQIKNVIDVIKSLLNSHDATSLFSSRSLNFRRFALLSAFFYVLTFSVTAMMALQKLQHAFTNDGEILGGYLLVLLVFGLLFLAKNASWSILGNVSRNKALFEEVRFTHQIFFISFALFLFPLQIIASYASISVYLTLIYISIGLIIILLIQYALRVLRLFLQNGVSFFFWFLYFCTLEMLPIMMAFYLVDKIGR